MPYGQAKIYSDGSHYIAIPPSTRPTAKKNGGSQFEDEKKKAFEKAYKETQAKSKARKLSEITEDMKAHWLFFFSAAPNRDSKEPRHRANFRWTFATVADQGRDVCAANSSEMLCISCVDSRENLR